MNTDTPIYDLNHLLHDSQDAREFYISLPDYQHGMLKQHAVEIHSEQQMRAQVGSLLQKRKEK